MFYDIIPCFVPKFHMFGREAKTWAGGRRDKHLAWCAVTILVGLFLHTLSEKEGTSKKKYRTDFSHFGDYD